MNTVDRNPMRRAQRGGQTTALVRTGDRQLACTRQHGPIATQTQIVASLCAIACIAFAGDAAAHAGTGLPGGFAAGFAHPFGGFDHLLAMVCVGLWGAFLGRPLVYALPAIFPVVMVIGAAIGMFGIPLAHTEAGIALSVLTLGACIATALRPPVAVAALVVGAFAICHGYAHGRELPSAADPVGYSLGFIFATGLLHVFGIGLGLLNECPGGVAITRGLGGIVCVAGAWFVVKAGA